MSWRKFWEAASGLGGIAAVITLLIYFGHSGSSPGPGAPPTGNPSTSTSSTTKTTGGLSHKVYLDTLPETAGDSVTPGQVSIGGHTYQHGLQFNVTLVFTPVAASYSIPSGARAFSVVIGNDDNQPNSLWDGISLLYEVFVDGHRVATGHARGNVHDPPLRANVASGSTITLQVTNENGAFGGTNADWANPVFH
jgi:NPCBM/NEW2 domain